MPFLQELARRAMVAGDATRAEAYALQASAKLRAHPAAFVTLAEARIRLRDGAGALDAADRALDIARTWHLGNGAIAQGHQLRAQALGVLGREADARAASSASRMAWPFPFPPQGSAGTERTVSHGCDATVRDVRGYTMPSKTAARCALSVLPANSEFSLGLATAWNLRSEAGFRSGSSDWPETRGAGSSGSGTSR